MTNSEREKVLSLVQSWLDDQSGYDEAVWPKLKQALQQQPTEDTVEVRIAVVVGWDGEAGVDVIGYDEKGAWENAYSRLPTDASHPMGEHIITAHVPRPKPNEIEGEVQRVE